ncbi:MAG: D-tyrosyl-tRNA(Tyr) deacylase [Synergistetes bacterium]|nr:MAG: D-tyrosyl-tRNA(Tyr) deacylase [bacterium 42_11]MBC7331317.1 D-tyrosyl-tRNA(Tyr) deacylase [Synergistota bacterium]MDK2871267.1 D-aminoacyl-tRNA deacylase [bacterium]
MRTLVQRVKEGAVLIDGREVGKIGKGVVVLLGVGQGDTMEDLDYLVDKVVNLRIFSDEEGKMNLSLIDVGGEALVVSQFTLYADCRKGRRPSFTDAAPPEKGKEMYEAFVNKLREKGIKVETGEFGAMMLVKIYNDGPVTIMLDSEDRRRPRRG